MGLDLEQIAKIQAEEKAKKEAAETATKADRQDDVQFTTQNVDDMIFETPSIEPWLTEPKKPEPAPLADDELLYNSESNIRLKLSGNAEMFSNFKSLIKDIKENANDTLADGMYAGTITGVEMKKSNAGKMMLVFDIEYDVALGLPLDKPKTTKKFSMLEHEKEVVKRITLQQTVNMLENVGVFVDDETDYQALFSNLNQYLANQPVTFEVKNSFVNFKTFNGKRV